MKWENEKYNFQIKMYLEYFTLITSHRMEWPAIHNDNGSGINTESNRIRFPSYIIAI